MNNRLPRRGGPQGRGFVGRRSIGYGLLMLLCTLLLVPGVHAQTAQASSPNLTTGIKIGGGHWATISDVRLQLFAPKRSTGSIPATANLHVGVSPVPVDVPIQGEVTEDGQFRASLATLNLQVAGSDLSLQHISITDDRLLAEQGMVRLPETLGGATSLPFYGVRIDQNGLQLNDVNEIVFANDSWRLGGPHGFRMQAVRGTLQPDRSSYQLVMRGPLQFDTPDAQAIGQVTIYDNGVIHPSAADLNIKVGGLALKASQVDADADGTLRAERASLTVPGAFGGADITVFNVVYSTSGDLTIQGGKFDLPRIKAGGFELSLRGSITREDQSYIINTNGTFEAPNLKGVPGKCSGIEVDVTLATNQQNTTVLHIQPSAELERLREDVRLYGRHPVLFAQFSDLSLREASIKINCKIPIGSTGFVLRSISGSITLDDGSTTISVSAGIETALAIGSTAVVSADPSVELTTSPFELVLDGSVKLFVFEMGNAHARITDRSFNLKIVVKTLYGTGTFEVNSWVNDSGFHLTGSGRFELGFDKGSIWTGCKKIIWKICIYVPPFSTKIGGIAAQAGEFKQNGGSVWGFKGEACFLGKCVGVWIDNQGNRRFGNVSGYQLLDPPAIAEARKLWQESRNKGMTVAQALHLSNGISINAAGDTQVTKTVTETSNLNFVLSRGGDLPTLSLIAPDGTVITPTTQLPNVTYTENMTVTTTEVVTPTTQVEYAVNFAQVGNWTAVLSGQPGPEEPYLFDILSTPAREVVTSFNVLNDLTAPSVLLRYKANNPGVIVTLFANSGPISHTVDISDTGTITRTIEEPLYYGHEIGKIPVKADGTLETFALDVSDLASGTYRVWVAVHEEDEETLPATMYAPEPLVVDHTDEWSSEFEPTTVVTSTFGEVHVTWTADQNADVDEYLVAYEPAESEWTPDDTALQTTGIDLVQVPGDDPLQTTTIISAGQSLSAIITDLDPGISYSYAIGAHDRESGKTTWSDWSIVTPLTAEYSIAANKTQLTIAPGSQASLNLTLSTEIDPYPEHVGLYLQCETMGEIFAYSVYLPQMGAGGGASAASITLCNESHGITATFSDNEILPTTSSVPVTVTIAVPSSLPFGKYTVPLTGLAGGHQVVIMLDLTVSS